jgi:dihydrolipoamide dehydrogenase
VRSLERVAEGVRVVFAEDDGVLRDETFAWALVAAGRRANLAGLGLEHAGVPLAESGRPHVDRTTMQWGRSNVFVAGDASQDLPLLHEAADEGRIAGENAARFPDVRPGARRSPLAIAFSDPTIAVIGRGHRELTAAGPVVTGEVSFADQGRSRVMRKNRGAARVYADPKTGRLLGAEIAGPRAEHLGHLLAWAHQQGMRIDEMLAMPFYHPVVEKGLRTALRDASARSKQGARDG